MSPPPNKKKGRKPAVKGLRNHDFCWWQLKYFFIFTPKIGEDEPNLTSIFLRWVVQPLTSGSILNLVLASWALKDTMVWHQAKCGTIIIPRSTFFPSPHDPDRFSFLAKKTTPKRRNHYCTDDFCWCGVFSSKFFLASGFRFPRSTLLCGCDFF